MPDLYPCFICYTAKLMEKLLKWKEFKVGKSLSPALVYQSPSDASAFFLS